MAWRPTKHLINGVLDNRTHGRVVGWLQFRGLATPVELDLVGDLEGHGFGKQVRIARPKSNGQGNVGPYWERFANPQRGRVGTMRIDDRGAYIEWFGEENGRVVLELRSVQVELVNE